MKTAVSGVLTVNGGSSSIKFAWFDADRPPRRALAGAIERIGTSGATFTVRGEAAADGFERGVAAPDHTAAVKVLMDWLKGRIGAQNLAAVGHRVVHGGPHYCEPQLVTAEILEELRRLQPLDPEHLPVELALIAAFHERYPQLPQYACFDTAFHHNLPRVAQLLAIPRRYESRGIRRYGFHGLSYEFLMGELARRYGPEVAAGRVILAHLGSGSSLAAVAGGQPIDTTMGFTPTAGVPMATRSGDLDPGLVWYLARSEGMPAERFNRFVNLECGLLGVSETSGDMRELLRREPADRRAAEAVALYCYQIKKAIGACAAALGGVDTLIFSGGIGENSAPVRARICTGLDFLGIALDAEKNEANATSIAGTTARLRVLVLRTDEESVIARSVFQCAERSASALQPTP